ncbi:AAA family ATPase [Undibacterium sp. RTI2.1]|uniref:MinD/ParA family ATP-binding protein n=1 Tax=unclassified Undibacterium TaxID=2630295 RepID=UPI002AB3C884|nr:MULTISPECIES: AAA family ATPase [unclassified Undibacterium]MDY7537997.1 AAA family ATPase [Undibacterium sp. 5I1]MEB0032024.1 AAA family ATPase [Undibacterium sp. RTI2.1]MEB0117220.1 AAA family ATPase [Undibacterium sp. RTI2.2]MEB0231087.1 AAA family ATPase [Undibacterium sp. 10I3]MEB0257514.1 AAA family ATPase [Undibacterium sp. 5I1]
MASFDQAEGLRRMLEAPRPRVLTFLSALRDEEKSGMLINLGASLARKGQQVLMVDARSSANSIGAWLNANTEQTLLDVARQRRTMQEAVKIVSAGLSVTMLSKYATALARLPAENTKRLSRVFDVAANSADLVIVDSEIDGDDAFPLASFEESEVVIQVSANAATIKDAYGLIKRVNNRVGRRSYGILVSGVTEPEARLVYTNMAQAASRYLAVPLHFVGYVPEDDHMKKAAHLGRSVIDAFPLAGASIAFSQLAERLALTARSTARSTLGLHGLPELGIRLGI